MSMMDPKKIGNDLCASCKKAKAKNRCQDITPGTTYCNAYRKVQ